MTVATLSIPNSKAREHVTLSIDALMELIADAEDFAYRRALRDAEVNQFLASALLLNNEAMHGIRARLHAAQVRAALTKPSIE